MLMPMMNEGKRAKLFRNGANQAVRIPREYELPGEEVIVRREGVRLIIEPARRRTLGEVLDAMEPLAPEDWPADLINDDDLLPLDDVNL
jgi:antitoxin VapB